MSFIVTTFIILHFKEVLTKNDTNDADDNTRDADEAREEEKCHVLRIVAFAVANEESDDSNDKH